uniref:Phosphodiesterase n=1 Tax=Strigamia maritima TaxID=126957 RepID=T1J2B1_STRMM
MDRSRQSRRNWNRNLPPMQPDSLDVVNSQNNRRSVSPRPNMRSAKKPAEKEKITPSEVYKFLLENPKFLEDYVLKEIDVDTLERWIFDEIQLGKMSTDTENSNTSMSFQSFSTSSSSQISNSSSKWKIMLESEKQKLLENVLKTAQDKSNSIFILNEMADCVASAVNAEGYNLYFKNPDTKEIYYVKREEGGETQSVTTQIVQSNKCLASFVANNRQTVRTTTPDKDSRFPDGVAVNKEKAKVVMCQPILQHPQDVLGVLECYRPAGQSEFSKGDEQIGHRYQVWCGITLFYMEMCLTLQNQKKLNSFLLTVIRSIFQDMGSMDLLIMKIMNFTQKLVKADRASLFLLNEKTKELYARIFDMKKEDETEDTEDIDKHIHKEIRFPVGTGFVGLAAETGDVINIPDVYQDSRFNKAVDERTGYRTRNLLCMPIFIRGSVIGVMQMVNKEDGDFNQDDIESFQTFATYCGLALHHAKLYDKIQRSENRFKIAMEMVNYHSSCSEDDVDRIKALPIVKPIVPNIDSYYFPSSSLKESEKIAQSVFMFQDLFGLTRFDLDRIIRFTITVKKIIAVYHITIGITVLQWQILPMQRLLTYIFPIELQGLALFIGCLCHDLDHRGKTNKFMLDTESPLAAVYTTSTLEHHHFNQTMTILQQDDLNILRSLSSLEYREVLNDIRHCILATDLALFFGYKVQLQMILKNGSFTWDNPEHRSIAKAIAMTACDLCASTKAWENQVETAKIIFEEFYDQGDAERNVGKEPIPMMDRNKLEFQPNAQVGFLKGICIPCYSLMAAVVPETQPMLDGCLRNLEKWEEMAEAYKLERQQSRDSSNN